MSWGRRRRTVGLVTAGALALPLVAAAPAGAVGGVVGTTLDGVTSRVLAAEAEEAGWVETEWGYRHESLEFPDGEEWQYPTMLTKEGYAGANRPQPNAYVRVDDGTLIATRIRFGDGPRGDYAVVQASIRGTNCSEGTFNLYDRRHAWDGHHVIEWIAEQPWSNGRVGMFGQSYPGQTAYYVAATQPPSLKAVMPSLLHADIYRDIFMPGGVQNYLFPILWTYAAGPHRLPQAALEGGSIPEDPICTQAQLTRDDPDVQDEAAWQAIQETDNSWMQHRAAASLAHLIDIPYYQAHNWHDQQTGPRAAVLFNHIDPSPREIVPAGMADHPACQRERDRLPPPCLEEVVPKRFVFSNGSHGFGGFANRDRWAWLDIWLLDMPDVEGLLDHQVSNYFEARSDGTATAVKHGDQWPFEDTDWQRLYLREGEVLSDQPPTGDEEPASYLSVQGRQNWFYEDPERGEQLRSPGGPDAALYESEPLEEELTIAGPMVLELYAELAGTDADFFVSLHDVHPDGRVEYLQRGLLKASHNEIDERRSHYVEHDGEQLLVQPYRPHSNPQDATPGEIERYDIEVWPVGHIFREGHRILVQIHAPPALDGLWGYTPTANQPAAVTVHHDAEHPSNLLIPKVTPDEILGEPWEQCPVPRGFPCADR
jgi:uncharacterized protein